MEHPTGTRVLGGRDSLSRVAYSCCALSTCTCRGKIETDYTLGRFNNAMSRVRDMESVMVCRARPLNSYPV